MRQQVIVIHGGTTFDNYEDYISYLKNREINLDKTKLRKDWKDSLQKELGENFEVLSPRMPNGTNARYEEWKIWFERIIPLLNDGIILIGHSLGGIFLAKYLSENVCPKKIKAAILVAAPFEDIRDIETVADFRLPKSLSQFEKQSEAIYLIQSRDDTSIPFHHFEKYKKALPAAKTMIFEDRGHFLQESFPELVKIIKNIH